MYRDSMKEKIMRMAACCRFDVSDNNQVTSYAAHMTKTTALVRPTWEGEAPCD